MLTVKTAKNGSRWLLNKRLHSQNAYVTFGMELSKMSSKFSSPHQESYRFIAVYSRGPLKTAKLFNIHRQADYVCLRQNCLQNFPSSNIKEVTDLVPLTV